MKLGLGERPATIGKGAGREMAGEARVTAFQPAGDRAAAALIPLYLWIVLNALDALLTWRGIPMGAFEANPALAALAHHTSVPTMLVIKVLMASALGVAIWQRRKLLVLLALDVLMVGIVAFNAFVISFFL